MSYRIYERLYAEMSRNLPTGIQILIQAYRCKHTTSSTGEIKSLNTVTTDKLILRIFLLYKGLLKPIQLRLMKILIKQEGLKKTAVVL